MVNHEEIQVNLSSTSPEIRLYTNLVESDLLKIEAKLTKGIGNKIKFDMTRDKGRIVITTKPRATSAKAKTKRITLEKTEFLQFLDFYLTERKMEVYNVEIISGQGERYYLRSKE